MTSLNSASSNYTECADEAKRRFFVRGQCGVPDFSIPYFKKGQLQSRETYGKILSWFDAIIVGGLFIACLWLTEKQLKSIVDNDVGRCSVDDYTLRIMFLPKLKKGKRSDLNALRRSLVLHFENLLNDSQKRIIPGRPKDARIHVLDLNFGNNDQDKIRLMRVRGKVALQLDLEMEKLILMRMYATTRGSLDTTKQEKRVSSCKVKFIEVAEAVKLGHEVLEARTAFITFASEEGFERASAVYDSGWLGKIFGSCRLTAPKESLYKGKHVFDIRPVMRPSDYIW